MNIQDSILEARKDVLIPSSALQVIRRFLTFKKNSIAESMRIPYHILVECQTPEIAKSFISVFQKALSYHDSLGSYGPAYSEKELLDETRSLDRLEKLYEVVFITDLLPASAVEEKKSVLSQIDSLTKMSVILCSTKDRIEERIKPDEHLYYQTFHYVGHAVMPEPGLEDIYEMLDRMISQANRTLTDKEAWMEYLNVVYPKASLQKEAFVKDLYHRILRQALENEVPEMTITSAFIPEYHKEASLHSDSQTTKGE